MDNRPGGFCTACGFEVESFDGLDKCPSCGDTGYPCAWANQVRPEINWHELHILVVWAENYGRQIGSQNTVFAIAKRLEKQLPYGPLTLAGELAELRKEFPTATTSDGDLNQDVQKIEAEESEGPDA